MIVSRWTDMGPEWKTEDIFRIRELFRENHISFRMPFSDLFFTSAFHMPEKDKRWGIRVREKDRSKAAALLIRENLACGDLLRGIVEEPRRPKRTAVQPLMFPRFFPGHNPFKRKITARGRVVMKRPAGIACPFSRDHLSSSMGK